MSFPYFVSTSGDIVIGDAALDEMLAPITAGEDILVGAPFADPDLAALANLTNTSGDFAVGGWEQPVVGAEDILVGWENWDPSVLTGAPARRMTPQQQMAALAQQNKALQQRMQQMQAASAKALAAAKQQGAQAVAAARQAAARPVGTPARVVREGQEKLRRIQLPINSDTNILAGQSRNVTTRPQVRAKPYKLTISNGDWWRILDLKIGNKSQFAASGALPGEVFAANATDGTLICDTAAISQDVILTVENRTGADHRFEGAFLCYVVD